MTMKRAGILVLNVHVKYFLSRLVGGKRERDAKGEREKDAFAIKVVHDGK